ncbi:MAG: SDR family oxidoreductase [Anaerolineae bacterium]
MNDAARAGLIVLTAAAALVLAAALIRRLRLYARRDFFANKVVILTGASRGIGRELALLLARRGARLVLAARTVQPLEQVAAECRAARPDVALLIQPTDVTSEADLQALVGAALAAFDTIDILINNAGVIRGGDFIHGGPAAFTGQMAVNLLAPMRLAQIAAPHLIAGGGGVIINMASVLGRHTMPFFTAYSVSKSGLIAFGEGLRRELRGQGVRVLTVIAGFTDTAMVHGAKGVLRRYGVRIMPAGHTARRIIEAVMLGRREVNLFGIEWLAIAIDALSPALADWLWGILAPPNLAQIAADQHTEGPPGGQAEG